MFIVFEHIMEQHGDRLTLGFESQNKSPPTVVTVSSAPKTDFTGDGSTGEPRAGECAPQMFDFSYSAVPTKLNYILCIISKDFQKSPFYRE